MLDVGYILSFKGSDAPYLQKANDSRDILLSDTSTFHRALLGAGNDAQLVVFDALPHAFWYHFELPETREALGIMAKFLQDKLGH